MFLFSLQSMYNDVTCNSCRSSITREKFEELCADLWEQALVPLKEVLHHASLKVDELYAVELIGGATRVPKLQVFCHLFIFFIRKITFQCGERSGGVWREQ